MSDNIYLRESDEKDCDILFRWVNERETRANSFDSHHITKEEHKAWFERMQKDDDQIQYILMKGEKPIGQIRLAIRGKEAEISYSISSDERGHGYGKAIIRLAIEHIQKECPEIEKLIGKVKPSNMASFLCFEKNGFEDRCHVLELAIHKQRKTTVE